MRDFTAESQRHGEDMKRSIWVTGSLVLQGLWALALLGLAAYSSILSVRRPDARDIRALALFSAFFGLLGGIGWYGLWRRKRWGWWLACVCSWGLAARFVYNFIDIVSVNGWSVVDWGFAVSTAYRRFYRSGS
jgi:uncharacterized membrane protein (DUF2068 family)